jgi:hypothetical protein
MHIGRVLHQVEIYFDNVPSHQRRFEQLPVHGIGIGLNGLHKAM